MIEKTYILEAYTPYERDQEIFRGSEENMKQFIKHRMYTRVQQKMGGPREVKMLEGFELSDISVLIEGPDIWSYVDEV